jgi:hypothetical protein
VAIKENGGESKEEEMFPSYSRKTLNKENSLFDELQNIGQVLALEEQRRFVILQIMYAQLSC